MKIIIIGGEGFLGKHLKAAALRNGISATSVDVSGEPDIRGLAEQMPNFKGYDRVYHLGGTLGTLETFGNVVGAVESNISSTVRILEKCLKADCAMTFVTLGNRWLNPYSITKNCAADFCRMYASQLGLNVQIAVTYNCFGAFQKTAPVRKIVPEFLKRIIRGQPVEIYGDGNQLVDMVYAPDLAEDLLSNLNPGTEHYGTAIARRVIDVATCCAGSVGKELSVVNLPKRPGETGDGVISPIPMSTMTPFDEAMKETATYYLSVIDAL